MYYASVLMATTSAVELELQILNAIFLGILCGIGMLYFQDLMPEKIGSATTLYANTSRVGWIIAGSVDGIMVEDLELPCVVLAGDQDVGYCDDLLAVY